MFHVFFFEEQIHKIHIWLISLFFSQFSVPATRTLKTFCASRRLFSWTPWSSCAAFPGVSPKRRLPTSSKVSVDPRLTEHSTSIHVTQREMLGWFAYGNRLRSACVGWAGNLWIELWVVSKLGRDTIFWSALFCSGWLSSISGLEDRRKEELASKEKTTVFSIVDDQTTTHLRAQHTRIQLIISFCLIKLKNQKQQKTYHHMGCSSLLFSFFSYSLIVTFTRRVSWA